MKGKRTINPVVISAVFIFSVLFMSSQVALAAKGGKQPPTPSIVINAVTVDYYGSNIMVTGSGLDTVTAATLGGYNVMPDISSSSETELTIEFSQDMANAVMKGSNSLVLNDNSAFSVYISSAIIVFPGPGTATCPCVADWTHFGSQVPPDGYSGLTPSCTKVSDARDQVAVQFIDSPRIWILTSEYNDNAKECAQVFDAPTRPLVYPEEHAACLEYLETNYIIPNPSAPPCF